MSSSKRGAGYPLYILQISVHGLFRGQNMELGCDADTGGQTTYVVELARALGRSKDVECVDLLTRQIFDKDISSDYAQPEEKLGNNVRILRVPCGPRRYIKKESLWSYLDQMVDRTLHLLCQQDRLPDIIHTHYADAGYVGQQLSLYLGIPQIHTGHSLGLIKKQGLIAKGLKESSLNKKYNFSRRISVEEDLLAHVSTTITSTQQEVEQQYGNYNNACYQRFTVIPPGTDVSRFSVPWRSDVNASVVQKVDRFLDNPKKPIVLAICRPVSNKNILGLVDAFGSSEALQSQANLVIVAGNRDNIQDMEDESQNIMKELLLRIDKYDLWGKIALPKHHTSEELPCFYWLAYKRRGVFINPAYSEPFGLTLIEAAASGVPIAATKHGGPKDIISNLRSGVCFDPYDIKDITETLLYILFDKRRWSTFSKRGVRGVADHYTWDRHAIKYIKTIRSVLAYESKRQRQHQKAQPKGLGAPLTHAKKLFISDIDNTLIGHKPSLKRLIVRLRQYRKTIGFGVATGRSIESTLEVLKKWHVPLPNIFITSVGTEIHYGSSLLPDKEWEQHISYLWRRDSLQDVLKQVPGLTLQGPEGQRAFKLSYYADPEKMPSIKEIHDLLRENNLKANIIYSHDTFLDVLPIRASKGRAVRYLAAKWGRPLKNFFVAGDSGNDLDMLKGDTSAIVVGNHTQELASKIRRNDRVYFATGFYAKGLLEGMDFYQEQIESQL